MARPRKFYFTPYTPTFGRKTKDFKPFVRMGANGTFAIGKKTLDALELNRQTFYKVYTDLGRRAVGLVFSDSIKPDDGWKAWRPKQTAKSLSMLVAVGSFVAELGDIVWPLPRLPLHRYRDDDIGQEFLWFRIPYKDEKVEDTMRDEAI